MFMNSSNLHLSTALWLAHDNYNHTSDPRTISVTTLLKPIRELALQCLPNTQTEPVDIASIRASRMGTAIHDSLSSVWIDPIKRIKALKALNYPDKVIDRVKVNPINPVDSDINVYVGVRGQRSVKGWTITGEFDFHMEESFRDYKTTGTYTYTANTMQDKYIKQLSMYQWIFSTLPSNGVGYIDMLFTDWKKSNTFMNNYPPADMVSIALPLHSPASTEAWIVSRLKELEQAIACLPDQSMLPTCTKEETWRKPSTFKYYSKLGATRATKDFKEDAIAAYQMLTDKSAGEVKEFKSDPIYCMNYCSSRNLCDQARSS